MTGNPVEHVDVVIVGAGISGIGAGLLPAARAPGQELRHPGGARGHPAAPGTCSATPASARTPTCTPSATSSSRGATRTRSPTATRSWPTCARRRARTASSQQIRFHHKVLGAAWSSARRALDRRRRAHRHRRAGPRSAAGWLFCAQRLLPLRRGLHPRTSRAASDFDRPRSCTRSTGRRTSTTPARRSWSSAAARRRSPWCPPWPRRPAHVTHAAALADATSCRCRRRTRSPTRCTRLLGDKRGYAADPARRTSPSSAPSGCSASGIPSAARRVIRAINAKQLPEGYPVDEHFNPPYDPWDQRLCAVPDADLFQAIRDGARPRWSPTGSSRSPRRASCWSPARELEADIIVTAPGLNLQAFGGISADGRRRAGQRLPTRCVYKGMMLSGVPNFALRRSATRTPRGR